MAPKPYSSTLRDQWTYIPEFAKDLTGKTVIVVGANVGLGFEAAKKFANMNPGRLILACRSQQRGNEALKAIKDATGCTSVECWTLDLANFKSISAFVDRFESEGGDRLDILLENAGVVHLKYQATGDGWETTLQVNHLGTALLAILLLPKLASTPLSPTADHSPRITIVSSDVHHWVSRLKEADQKSIIATLNGPETANMGVRYEVSKLLNVFFTRALSSRMKPTVPVTVNTVTPGLCDTSLSRSVPFPLSLLFKLYKLLIARTPEVGSRTLTHASLWGSKDEVHGKYFNKCQIEEESDYVVGEEGKMVEKRLWDETIEILENVDPRVKDIVAEYLTS